MGRVLSLSVRHVIPLSRTQVGLKRPVLRLLQTLPSLRTFTGKPRLFPSSVHVQIFVNVQPN